MLEQFALVSSSVSVVMSVVAAIVSYASSKKAEAPNASEELSSEQSSQLAFKQIQELADVSIAFSQDRKLSTEEAQEILKRIAEIEDTVGHVSSEDTPDQVRATGISAQ